MRTKHACKAKDPTTCPYHGATASANLNEKIVSLKTQIRDAISPTVEPTLIDGMEPKDAIECNTLEKLNVGTHAGLSYMQDRLAEAKLARSRLDNQSDEERSTPAFQRDINHVDSIIKNINGEIDTQKRIIAIREERIKDLKENTSLKGLPERYLTQDNKFSKVGIDSYNSAVSEVVNNPEFSDEDKERMIQELRSSMKALAQANYTKDVKKTKDSLSNKLTDFWEREVTGDKANPNRYVTEGNQAAEKDRLRASLDSNRAKLVEFFDRLEKAPITSRIGRDDRRPNPNWF